MAKTPATVQVFVPMPSDVFEAGCDAATAEHLTLADLLCRLLTAHLARRGSRP